ncbi:energy transducer TonB [Candidatus Poribacteria bacterium]|nr:energy transducer TonB [Candidatus Poribacteria bacterium]
MNTVVQIVNKFLYFAKRSQQPSSHKGFGIGKLFSSSFLPNTSFMLSVCLHLIGISIIGLSSVRTTDSNSNAMQIDVFSMSTPKPVAILPTIKKHIPKLVVPQPIRLHRQQLQTVRPITPVITTETSEVTTLAQTPTLTANFTLNAPQNSLSDVEPPVTVSVGTKPVFTSSVNVAPQRVERNSDLSVVGSDSLQIDALPLNMPTINEPTQNATFLKKVDPVYPESARSTHQEGLVVLEATIGIDGKAQNIRIIEVTRISGLGCEEAAIQALKSSLFTPAMQGKVAVTQRLRIPYRFSLKS